MNKSSIEITDQAYLIRLQKVDFDYVRVRQVLNLLMAREQTVGEFSEKDLLGEDDLRSRQAVELGDRFDHLSDK